MRSTDERIAAVQMRSRALKRQRDHRRGIVATGLSAAACVAAIFGLAFYIPDAIGDASAIPSGTSGAFGSIVASNGALGFIVIGLVAFCLGVAVTLLCVKIRESSLDDADDVGEDGAW